MVCQLGGAKRWIRIAGFNFQPSDVAKIVLVVFFASFLADQKSNGKIKGIWNGFLFPIFLGLIPCAIVFLLQNHFSAALILFAIPVALMFAAGTRLTYLIMATLAGVGSFFAYLTHKGMVGGNGSFRFVRVQVWQNPFAYMSGDGYQIVQSLYAIGSGGIFGSGLGESKQKYLYLPEPQNDFIFAVLGEELGLIGCFAVILLFLIFLWRGIVIAKNTKDPFGSLIVFGLTFLIVVQALINMAVVTNTIPVTGMQLPFFSYGGTAIICNLIAIGLIQSVARSSKKEKKDV